MNMEKLMTAKRAYYTLVSYRVDKEYAVHDAAQIAALDANERAVFFDIQRLVWETEGAR